MLALDADFRKGHWKYLKMRGGPKSQEAAWRTNQYTGNFRIYKRHANFRHVI